VGVDIGVELAREAAERRLDLPRRRVTADAEQLVGVAPHQS
jgi:hypothetical protein